MKFLIILLLIQPTIEVTYTNTIYSRAMEDEKDDNLDFIGVLNQLLPDNIKKPDESSYDTTDDSSYDTTINSIASAASTSLTTIPKAMAADTSLTIDSKASAGIFFFVFAKYTKLL